MDNCIFCKIANHQVPKEFIYEDEEVMVFADIHPVKPVHILIVPKQHYADFMNVEDSQLWNKVREIAQKLIVRFDLSEKGYRLSVNGGGAQIIDHFHMHLMGPMGKKI